MIKYLPDNEKIKSKLLYEEVFNDKEKFLDYYFNDRIKKSKILILYKDEVIASMLHRIPHVLNVNGMKVNADYIYAVATKPEYRRMGLMGEILSRAIRDMYNEKVSIVYLIPEDYRVYLKFGFQYIYNYNQINYSHIVQANFDKGKYSLADINQKNMESFIKFSDRIIKEHNRVFLYRDSIYYNDLIKHLNSENGSIKLLYKEEEVAGYCYYSNEERLIITEFVCEEKDKDVFLQLLNEELNYESVKINGILNPWEGCNESELIMARILDVREIGSYLTPKVDFRINIEISDPIIENNNGIFTFENRGTACEITPTDEESVISMSIDELTQWLLSYKEFPKMPDVLRPNGVFINDIL